MSTAADAPYAGTWKFNVAQSKIRPGPPPQSLTVTIIIPGGETTVNGMDSEGKPFSWSFTPSEGVAVPITGLAPGSTVTKTTLDKRHVKEIWKEGKGCMVGRAVISKDGKSFTYTQKGTNEKGQTVDNVILFAKE